MKSKFNKESRNLIIALLLGDGTISNNRSFKICHSKEQETYLAWKIKKMNGLGIRNNGIKSYTVRTGYNTGRTVVYTQLNVVPFFKVLRKIMYRPKKIINNRTILNRLTSLGVAIWYMDDGHINISYGTNGKVKSCYIRIATCQLKEDNQVIIDYFKEVWDVSFYQFPEGRNTYSLCCGTTECKKFISIIKDHVLEIPEMWYKIRNKMTKDKFNAYLVENKFLEMPNADICQ